MELGCPRGIRGLETNPSPHPNKGHPSMAIVERAARPERRPRILSTGSPQPCGGSVGCAPALAVYRRRVTIARTRSPRGVGCRRALAGNVACSRPSNPERPSERWRGLSLPGQVAFRFHYRQAPQPLFAENIDGQVWDDDPAPQPGGCSRVNWGTMWGSLPHGTPGPGTGQHHSTPRVLHVIRKDCLDKDR